MIDYTIYYRTSLTLAELGSRYWDTYVSAFNGSERVQSVFKSVHAKNKHWLIHQEYGFASNELPNQGRLVTPFSRTEADFLSEYLDAVDNEIVGANLCVDITGLMRPHLMLLVQLLKLRGVTKFDAMYAEPVKYVNSHKTEFSYGAVDEVRQVQGFEGSHTAGDESRNLLIIGAGFDDRLVRLVSENKAPAQKKLLLGFPPLRADMYQQSRLRMDRASEQLGPLSSADYLFAPANDPFVTAQVVSEAVSLEETKRGTLEDLYLCPLGTKPQALGFALFFLKERMNSATSIIFPFPAKYSKKTTQGLTQVSIYTLDLS